MRPLVAALLGFGLTACAALPVPTLDSGIPSAWQQAPGFSTAPADLKGWWGAFDDPVLDARVAAALEGNPSLREASARLQAARILQGHAGDPFRPAVRFHAGDEVAPSATASYFISSFDAGWEFGVFGRREGRRRALQGAAEEAAAQFDGARVSLVAEVVADHLLLGAARERLALLEDIATLRGKQRDFAQRRRGLSLAADAEGDEATIEFERAQSALGAGRRQIQDSGRQLSALLGTARPEESWLADARLPTLKAAPPLSTPADLLRTRPEIRRAQAAVLQAAGERDLARAERLPNLGIVGSIRWSTTILHNNRFASTSYIEAFGPMVDIPLIDWGLRRARADAQSKLLDASIHAYRDAVLRGFVEAESALGGLQNATEQLDATTRILGIRQRATDAATKRVALKLSSELEATNASLALLEARLALVDARATQGLAYVTLYKALGGASLPPSAKAP